MPAFWYSLKRSWQCNLQTSNVHDPERVQSRKSFGFRCSRSVSNLRDVIHGSKRHIEKPPSCSPSSLGSSDFLSPLTHQVVLNESTCEIKISGFRSECGSDNSVSSKKIHGDHSTVFGIGNGNGNGNGSSSKPRIPTDTKLDDSSTLTCKKCFDKFKTLGAVEAHHLFSHAVTELKEGDSSRRIVEIICRASWMKSEETNYVHIRRVLKVHNLQITTAQFEEQRELVKIKASKLPTRHPRCLADGNELLRFHGTTIACSLGMKGSSTLCTFKDCGVCQILRNGFGKKDFNGGIGVFTASTSGRALESVEISDAKLDSARKALLVCRVIAGRVHKPLENFQELAGKSSFDSLAAKVGQNSNIEELYLLNPRALLPCFVVIY